MSGNTQPGILFPAEPTREMLDAAAKVVFEEAGTPWVDGEGFAEDVVRDVQRRCFLAMAKVVASPSPVDTIVEALKESGLEVDERSFDGIREALDQDSDIER